MVYVISWRRSRRVHQLVSLYLHHMEERALPGNLHSQIIVSPPFKTRHPSLSPPPFSIPPPSFGYKEAIIIVSYQRTVGSRELSRYSDWLPARRRKGRSSSLGRVKNALFFTTFRPGMWPTQPSIQRVPGALSPGVKRQRREAEQSPPPVPRSRIRGSIHPIPHTPSWRGI
jgi:hypothetical protein